MLRLLLALPLQVILMGIGALAMLVPSVFGVLSGDIAAFQVFGGVALLFLILTGLLALATNNYEPRQAGRSHLLALLSAFAVLPLMLAVPVRVLVADTTFLNAYVEMVSSLTTTGATLFDNPERLAPAVHLWRALVAWIGGFFVLVTAIAILAPMSLGGFDVLASAAGRKSGAATSDEFWSADGGRRLMKHSGQLFPAYLGLTALLWLLLVIVGTSPFHSLIHALSVLSTSGISANGQGLAGAGIGFGGEALIFVFLLLALSRQTVTRDPGAAAGRLFADPELRMGLFFVAAVPTLLFLRHWIGAFEVDEVDDLQAAAMALWGGVFTVLSFLTTTGFVSEAWDSARNWSGLATPGIILLGLALVGGGVATTAGGVKLLRVYALYLHGLREMDRLVHPSSIAGSGSVARRLRREGAYLAWIFFMLFALSLAVMVSAFAITGLNLPEAITLSIAALSTTGPVAAVTLAEPISYGDLSNAGKYILVVGMVLGRLETLVIIALFNPEFWRR